MCFYYSSTIFCPKMSTAEIQTGDCAEIRIDEAEVVLAFMSYIETQPTQNDFQTYWATLWKPITQRCLNMAKHTFVLEKAFELFRAHVTRIRFTNSLTTWSEVFIGAEEEQVLETLCKHAKLKKGEFMDYGLQRHRNRCRKYYTKSHVHQDKIIAWYKEIGRELSLRRE